ncbi:tipN [Brevundimonas naejangsanensis]|uniref:TipN n=1 Tax=Brevundimonas naejangsanensis TaxID=588932 RepID=A0A494RR15_9CAUL|nr:tipN [Brevundimonas naejangsanensis]AYG95726.1 tipN [Brevundimonas naejangsanensis]
MKSRHRPPLNLTESEPASLETGSSTTPEAVEAANEASLSPAELQPVLEPAPNSMPPRPMSERQRRRLAEQQALAEKRAAEAEKAERALSPFAESADAPPATIPPAAPPARQTAKHGGKTPATAGAGNAYLIAGLASALWVGGLASWFAYELGSGMLELDPLRLAVYALILLAPVGLSILLAHAVRQGAGLAQETRRAREMADALVGPTALAANQAGQVLNTLRDDIDRAAQSAERARDDLASLREALVKESSLLNEAAELAGGTARRLAEQLSHEREQMGVLGGKLEGQASAVVETVERQSRMVADASDLAQTQLREAEAALAARAADLAAAANEAQEAARAASDDLARQTLRLETAGSGVAEQIQSVEEGLGQQRAALVTAAYALRTDQEDFSAQIESQRAQLLDHLSQTRAAAEDLNRQGDHAAAAIKAQVDAVVDQFKALVEMSQREADGFDHATKLSLDRFEALAAESRDLLVEETRRALEALQATADEQRAAAQAAIEQAQIRADRLGESLFDAAQKADEAAEARIDGARRIVAQTADMVDMTGEKLVESLQTTLAQVTDILGAVEQAVAEMDERAARLPDEARARVDAVRATVEEGLNALTAASRKAAEDTEALDAGFQDRVRRNYEMLTEAVRLMGAVSSDGGARRRPTVPAPREAAPPASTEPRRAAPPSSLTSSFGLRGRLRPVAPDAGIEAIPAAPAPIETPPADPVLDAGGSLDWQDLVQPEQPPAPQADPSEPLELTAAIGSPQEIDALAARVTAAIRRMGVDPNALLPRPRVEEAAQAFAGHDPARARQIVRRVAPAAVRSVSRRVLSDDDLRTDAEAYVRAFAHGLKLQAERGDAGDVQARLATDEGRAFMLLDAAVGDLG